MVMEVESARTPDSDADALTGNRNPFFNFETGDQTSTIRDNIEFIRDNPDTFENLISNTSNLFLNPIEDSIPVYGFFEPTLGIHLFTPSASERDIVEDEFENYESEGVAFYTFPSLDTVDSI